MTWVDPESRDKSHYETRRREDRHGVGGDMKTQAETAAKWPQVNVHGPQEPEEVRSRFSPGPLEGTQRCQHLNLRLSASEAARGYISVL